ncbi:hypothetical protein IEQ34_003457 [Dendrobium chrysotoxum]|uniref:Phytocyanin domain-containing protein n=1 Tax=Dendrobium chrysotoxum TaxID=161865 RepID=A0AAV7HL46_DENCH|nr:hypothetical protein IEQ34_003457 [Dendrobium chrysotoxum]
MSPMFFPSSPGFNPAMGRGNASACSILIAVVLAAAAGGSLSSAANVYNVGDGAGWTIAANYSSWASAKTFRIGDTIVFFYNKSFHNVVEVSKADYRSCNAATPIATHSTGNDSISITRYGHRFFICGFPGHCAAGQKLDVRVPKHISSVPPSPSSDGSQASSGGTGSSPAASAPGSVAHGEGGAKSIRGFGMMIVATVAAASVVVLH